MSYTVPRTNPVSLRRGERMRFAAKRRPVRQNPTPGVDLTSVLVGAMIGAAAIYLTRSSTAPAACACRLRSGAGVNPAGCGCMARVVEEEVIEEPPAWNGILSKAPLHRGFPTFPRG